MSCVSIKEGLPQLIDVGVSASAGAVAAGETDSGGTSAAAAVVVVSAGTSARVSVDAPAFAPRSSAANLGVIAPSTKRGVPGEIGGNGIGPMEPLGGTSGVLTQDVLGRLLAAIWASTTELDILILPCIQTQRRNHF